jgi:hypothetical protein
MPIDPSQLRVQAPEAAADRPCRKCGYDVRGMPIGHRCPECGTPIASDRKRSVRFADNLTDSPMWYLVVVAVGTVAMGLALFGSIGLMIFERARSSGWNPLSPAVVAIAGGVLALMWIAGVVLSTLRRPVGEHTVPDAILDSDKLRWVTRGLQVCFVASVGFRYAATVTRYEELEWLASAATLGSLYALAPLCVYLGSLADWAGDTGAGTRLRGATWLIQGPRRDVGGGGFVRRGLAAAGPGARGRRGLHAARVAGRDDRRACSRSIRRA